MTLQQFAKQRNLKIKQLRELCQELFENIPETLSPENMEALDKALATASQSLTLPPSSENIATELTTTNQESNIDNSQNEKVIRIVGISVLKQNLQLYLQNLKKHYLAQQFEIDSLQFQIEQGFYSNLASYQQNTQSESIQRINKNSQLFTRQGIEALKTDSNAPNEDVEILGDIGDLMDFFSVV